MKTGFSVLSISVFIILISQNILAVENQNSSLEFPRDSSFYHEEFIKGTLNILKNRILKEPFNLVASLIFLFAIMHTFVASKIMALAHSVEHRHRLRIANRNHEIESKYKEAEKQTSFLAGVLHFMGEVEAIFGLWILVLLLAFACLKDWSTAVVYMDSVNFTEPMFLFVIMTIAATRPVMRAAEKTLEVISGLGGGSPAAWWFCILTIGPILGSFITEPGAMTISAILIGKHIYDRKPSINFAYATIGLLFVNISVGGTLTNFAAPPVLMVAGIWNWSSNFMLTNFGWKAIVGILIANSVYFAIFRIEMEKMKKINPKTSAGKLHWNERDDPLPLWVIVIHLVFMLWTVLNSHYPALFMGGFLFFLGFAQATRYYQNRIDLKPAFLVGFFLASLVTHGGLQGWWIGPVLGSLDRIPLMLGATFLTGFNDNAAITYLSTLIPNFSDGLKYAVVAGAVTGGGLTVIANAPNPAGQAILQKYFKGGVSPLKLAISALIPTIIMGICFMFLS